MNALFFIRHHNDFDSFTPVVDGWISRSPDHRATVYFASPRVKWRGDYRTRMLTRTGKVTMTDLWEVGAMGDGGRLARAWQTNAADDRLYRRLLELRTELSLAPGFASRFGRWVESLNPDIVAFDHFDVPNRRGLFGFFGYQQALSWVNRTRRPLIALPHGLLLFWGPEAREIRFSTPYDAIFVENEWKKSLIRTNGENTDTVIATGSPRYDPDWVARVAGELAETSDLLASPRGKTRIAFFATTAKHYYDFSSLLKWLKLLAAHPQVELVVQPHPRGQKRADFASIENIGNVTIDPDTPASLLIARADLVSTLVSSVVVEAAVTNREILYPKFLNRASTNFDEAGACISLNSASDTHAAIDAYREGKRIDRDCYDLFLKRYVYGDGDPHTIARITARMAKLAEGRN